MRGGHLASDYMGIVKRMDEGAPFLLNVSHRLDLFE